MKLSEFQKKRSNPLLQERMLVRKKQSELKEIRKTLTNERMKTDYQTIYREHYGSNNQLQPQRKEAQSNSAKARLRSQSQLSDRNNNVDLYNVFKRSASPAEAPINIFISVEKLNKMKINSSQRRKSSRKSELFEAYVSKKNSSLDRDKLRSTGMAHHETLPRRKHPRDASKEEQTTIQPDNNDQNKLERTRRRLRTLEDESEPRKKQASANRKHDPDQKLKYEQLKNNYERFPAGFKKYRLLGRGGFSLVWMGFHKKTKKAYAVKQILTHNKYQTHLKEIWFSNFFFANGKPRKEFEQHPGVNNILVMYDYEIEQTDTWIIYELCDGSLGWHLYDLYKDESGQSDEYIIKYKPFYEQMRQNTIYLKHLIIEMAKTLDLLAQNNIVHSDVKTENILIRLHKKREFCSYKLIDYGSSFAFSNLKQYTLATPQYMCPELLNFILHQNKHECNKEMLKLLKDYSNTSAIDVWGLGCIVLEIINGLPLWMTVDTVIEVGDSFVIKKGLFSVENRSFRKIIQKQLKVIGDLDAFFEQENYSGVLLDEELKRVIKRMLDLDPSKRIRPSEILQELQVTAAKIESRQH